MDIAGLSMLQSQQATQLNVNVALLKKSQDVAVEQHQQLDRMQVDTRVEAVKVTEPFKGAQVDVRA
ncbi:YjfB family protein [Geomicrobium sp. JCM 19038]|uniref:YjfB family protein n=1 Tax=Geomicrobium sp. JCM 19038 TaxID=1460635 RepID=UPI00045F2BD9|nr:YjfB family protein [Geomicrobium sp. JCM 19038]GAK07224.1 hypothetical protein JCM19038_946 [Geomicrobium sp. JCM 19038]